MNNMSESSKELIAIIHKLTSATLIDWLQNSLFTWRWWLGVIISIVPWVLWMHYRDKKSTSRLLLVGFFSMIIAFIVNTVGTSFNLWFFEYRVIPVVQIFLPWDFTLIPVSIMVLLQIKPNKFIFVKTLFFASFSAYIA
ncbi:MAG TPA: CBO0543 family protein, partial [Patescibacteria group bacterium]|nr:CBO0543 family protein [Patescibacteria group bacterium]